jgi:hypothetical protein
LSAASARLAIAARRSGSSGGAHGQRHEIVVRDRVLVLPPQVPLAHQQIDVRRVCVGRLALEQRDRVDVLHPPEDQLLLFFALRGVFPDRHGDREHDRHDAHGDQKHRHCISLLALRLTR